MKKILLLVLILIILVAGVFAYVVLNRSAKPMTSAQEESALANILGRKPNLGNPNAPTGNLTYKSAYVSFMYPAIATIYKYRDPNLANDTSVIDIFSFDMQNPRLVFNFSVREASNSIKTISDISDVRLREDKTRGYRESNITADGESGLSFELAGSSPEESGFFLVNGRIYSISVTGSDQKAIENLFNLVISSIKFL